MQSAWRRKNRHKTRAHRIAAKAIKSGMLVKTENCENCGDWTNKLHAHHPDYSKPLDVVWLCNRCHSKLHGITSVLNKNFARGEKHGRAKLNQSQVDTIRDKVALGMSKRGIAREYGVSEKLIRLIAQEEIWNN